MGLFKKRKTVGTTEGRSNTNQTMGTANGSNNTNSRKIVRDRITFPRGSVYEGEFYVDEEGREMLHGYGRLTTPDGDVYEGGWKDDLKSGKGKYTGTDGTSYDGEWKEGKMHGFGIMVYPDGGRYEGEWAEGFENGHGVMEYVEGDSYDGEWKDGKRHGSGTYTYANGEIYRVQFEDDEMISREPVAAEKMNFSDIPDWGSVKSGAFKAGKEEAARERVKGIAAAIDLLQHPRTFANPADRSIEKSCYYLEKYIEESGKLFVAGKNREAAERIGEILGFSFDLDSEWIYKKENEYFSQFLYDAIWTVRDCIDFYTPNPERIVVAAVNTACYMWRKYSVTNVFRAAAYLWTESSMDDDGGFLWLKRMGQNGDAAVSSDEDIMEAQYGFDLGRYSMGSDCRLYDPNDPREDLY